MQRSITHCAFRTRSAHQVNAFAHANACVRVHMQKVCKHVYMYKNHTRNAFTRLSKRVCIPGEMRLHVCQNEYRTHLRYMLHLGGTVYTIGVQ